MKTLLSSSFKCHRGGKSTWPDRDSNTGPLAYRASTDHWTTEPHGRPVTISPCLIRFIPESAWHHAGTDETVPLLLAARAWTHTGHQMSQERKKHMAQLGLEPRTSCRSCELSDNWATGPHNGPVTISPCLIRFVRESARNHAGTDETVPLLLAARAPIHTGNQMSQGRKKHMAWPGLEPKTSHRPRKHSDHWATEPHSRPVTEALQ